MSGNNWSLDPKVPRILSHRIVGLLLCSIDVNRRPLRRTNGEFTIRPRTNARIPFSIRGLIIVRKRTGSVELATPMRTLLNTNHRAARTEDVEDAEKRRRRRKRRKRNKTKERYKMDIEMEGRATTTAARASSWCTAVF